jgi:hypothetical protein
MLELRTRRFRDTVFVRPFRCMAAGVVLYADRSQVRLNPDAFVTDVSEFEARLQAAGQCREAGERVPLLQRAAELYRGELLPGYDEDWILPLRRFPPPGNLRRLRLRQGQPAACPDALHRTPERDRFY